VKKALCYSSVLVSENHHQRLAVIKDAGFDGIEAPQFDTTQETEEIAGLADEIGLEIHSVMGGSHWQMPLSEPDEEARRQGVAGIENALQQAAIMGAETVLVVPGVVNTDVPYDQAYEVSQKSICELLPTAEELDIVMCLENVWNKFLLSPLEMRDYIDSFDSPLLQAYFDVGNILLYGYPEQWIRILGKRVKRVHFKDFKKSVGTAEGFCDLLEGDVNWPAVMAAFDRVGYNGYAVAELFPYKHHPDALLANTSISMDWILGRSE